MSDRGPYWQFKRKPSAQPPPPNPTLVEIHEWVQPSHCHQHDNTLRHGHLLRWMDIAACLSGMVQQWFMDVQLYRMCRIRTKIHEGIMVKPCVLCVYSNLL